MSNVPERIWISPHQAEMYAKPEYLRDPSDTEQYARVREPADSVAPTVNDLVDRQRLLGFLRERVDSCHRNAKNTSKPEAYRLMMGHFAEAGEQMIETIAEFGADSGIVSRGTEVLSHKESACCPTCKLHTSQERGAERGTRYCGGCGETFTLAESRAAEASEPQTCEGCGATVESLKLTDDEVALCKPCFDTCPAAAKPSAAGADDLDQ